MGVIYSWQNWLYCHFSNRYMYFTVSLLLSMCAMVIALSSKVGVGCCCGCHREASIVR